MSLKIAINTFQKNMKLINLIKVKNERLSEGWKYFEWGLSNGEIPTNERRSADKPTFDADLLPEDVRGRFGPVDPLAPVLDAAHAALVEVVLAFWKQFRS